MRLYRLGLPGSQGLKPSMPPCQCNNLIKTKVLLLEISALAPFIHFPCSAFGSSHSLLLLCPQPWHSMPFPSSVGGRMGVCFPPSAATNCLPGRCRQSLPPPLGCRHCSAAPCQAVPVQWARSTLSDFKVTAQSRSIVPTAHGPGALLNVVICGWASATSQSLQGYGASGWGRCAEQGSKETGREEMAGDGDIWWGAMQEGYCQKQNVWQPLGTDLHYKYYILHSKARV